MQHLIITLDGTQYIAYPRESWIANDVCSVCHTMLGTPQMHSRGNTLVLPDDAPRPYTAWPTQTRGPWRGVCHTCTWRSKETD